MNIALCTDSNYVKPSLVCITSVFENNKSHSIVFYVLTDGLTLDEEKQFRNIAKRYGQTIDIVNISNELFDNLVTTDRFPKSMYYRFLLPDIVKASRVLYLDVDIIVRHDIGSLYRINIENWACAVVEDGNSDSIRLRNINRYLGKYFNSGMMLINLDYWRMNNVSSMLVNFINENPSRCKTYPDQDALNIVLEDKVVFLPYTYNFQEVWYRDLNKLDFIFTKHAEVQSTREDPVIVHFSVRVKPWHKECSHPHKDWFFQYSNINIETKIAPRYYYNLKNRLVNYIKYLYSNYLND